MADECEYLLLSLNVPVQIGPEHSLLPDGLQGVKRIFPVFLDQVDLAEGSLSDPLVELEVGQRDDLDPLLLLYELVQLVDILLAVAQPLLLLFLQTVRALQHRLGLGAVVQHALDHHSVVRSVLVQEIFGL